MTTERLKTIQARGEFAELAARTLAGVAKRSSRSLARIARAYEEYESGRFDAARLIEVVRQETQRAANQPRQATRRSRPVRG